MPHKNTTMTAIGNWDLITTVGGVMILTIPGPFKADIALACPDAVILISRERCLLLRESGTLADIIRIKRKILVVGVGANGLDERIASVRLCSRPAIAGARHAQAA